MAVEFDPAWEYHVDDPEIAELFAESGRLSGYAGLDLGRADGKGWNIGVRFGRGCPDRFSGRLAPPRPESVGHRGRPRRPDSPLSGRNCQLCGAWYARLWASTFCSNRCAARSRRRKQKVWRGVTWQKECERCGCVFARRWAGQRYCSRVCIPYRAKQKCQRCGNAFQAKKAAQRYCTMECYGPGRRRVIPDRQCEWRGCGVTFRPDALERRFCSTQCFGLSLSAEQVGRNRRIDRDRARELYHRGLPTKTICEQVGAATPASLRRVLKEMGVALRKPGNRRRA